ncbi:MAG TPA: potassium channel family protein [Lacipirellulaceae bacterium]|nr:potassium channel family protein [Lacipirellulaceae bacterium]
MRIVATAIGIAIMFLVLLDAFEAMVLPRRATRKFRPARFYYRSLWTVWEKIAALIKRRGLRTHILSIFGPLSLLGLFVLWVVALIFSFSLFQWSLAEPMGSQTSPPSLSACVYVSGQTFFTLGYGDLAPTGSFGRFLSVLESGMGFGFMAVIIGYLPVLYQAFSRRERTISLLDARAGSPPTAGEILSRLAKAGALSEINNMLWEWESWSADLLESQLSFPVLAYYRSQHDNQSWLAGLATILDTCALLLANVVDINRHQVQITFAIARHAAVDSALIFKTPPREPLQDRLPEGCYSKLMESLSGSSLHVDISDASAARLKELRVMYEPFLAALADYFKFELPPIASGEVAIDNWQRSAWQQRAPGIGSLPIANPGDHFS